MCSIAGAEKLEISPMLEMMKHRSPDGMDLFIDGKFGIGMGRLSIIDLESPGLCLYHEDEYYLAFNGEIYNYKELRKEIGGEFRTESDTEVLLKAYKKWGIGCLDKFNGMFAFAIYDGKTVFLARDIAGEKPLYYSTTKPFRFASEAKVLDYACLELPPAHYLIYDFKEIKIKKWWNFEPKEIDIENAEETLEQLLEDSIRLRTQSDVPYALYYSGGVDSSLISTFHDFKYKFTYVDKDYQNEFKEIFPKILWHLDYPVSSFSPFGLWKLAEQASKKVKVVLSGEGADELFGGYVRYLKPHFNWLAQNEFPSYKSMFEPAKNVSVSGWQEFNGNMRELLRMGDRMSSAWGLENRCPFLDRRIIEFAFSLRHTEKIRGLEMKSILRRILLKRNPAYRQEEKKGLYCNVNKWIGSSESFTKDDYIKYQTKIYETFRGNPGL